MNFFHNEINDQDVFDFNISSIPEDKYWGMHLIIDMAKCDEIKISDKNHIIQFSKELVSEIKMNSYGEPIVEYFAKDDPNACGFSLVQLIETSNICAHFAEKSKSVYLDIFSCKTFSPSSAIEIAKKYFKPQTIKPKLIFRGLNS
tara:strand:+ start:466 stop:900 length:435 start_codon:yes stop_codon:yes gene_type:complete